MLSEDLSDTKLTDEAAKTERKKMFEWSDLIASAKIIGNDS
jgi:hypothetical protein